MTKRATFVIPDELHEQLEKTKPVLWDDFKYSRFLRKCIQELIDTRAPVLEAYERGLNVNHAFNDRQVQRIKKMFDPNGVYKNWSRIAVTRELVDIFELQQPDGDIGWASFMGVFTQIANS